MRVPLLVCSFSPFRTVQMGVKLENVMQIEAPPSTVWGVTVDIERWPEWTPNFKKIRRLEEGPFGGSSTALIQQPGLPEAKWVVTQFKPGEEFSWETRVLGMRMIGTHAMYPAGTGTQSVLRIELSGTVATLLSQFLRYAARRSLARENAGLKVRCEALAAQR
jgi:uncharacterized membrane protein